MGKFQKPRNIEMAEHELTMAIGLKSLLEDGLLDREVPSMAVTRIQCMFPCREDTYIPKGMLTRVMHLIQVDVSNNSYVKPWQVIDAKPTLDKFIADTIAYLNEAEGK